MKRIGAATALEVRATGIPYTFAPCIAVKKKLQQNSLLVALICFKSDNSVFFFRFVGTRDGAVAMKAIAKIIRLFKQ